MLTKGHVLDNRFQIIDVLGKGGMGTVYLARNIRLGNLWAIKEITVEERKEIGLLREPNILKNLSHTNIPRIVDIFYENNNLYMVEDYIKGITLEKYIERNGKASDEEAAAIALKLCEIIKYLHSFNPPIIYRDLKPSNIMIKENRDIILIDFGISRLYKHDQTEDTIYMGSKGYAAPEQYGREQSNIQTDIYGIGAILYFMVNGKAPLNLMEPLKNESYSKRVGKNLKEVIKKAMKIEKTNRYETVGELKSALLNSIPRNELKTKILNQPMESEDEKTKILEARKKSKHLFSKNKTFKKIVILAACIAILFLAMTLIDKINRFKDESKVSSNKKIEESTTKVADTNKGEETQEDTKEAKDTIIQGVLYKNSPTILGKASEDEEDEEEKENRGKAKGKNKNKPKDDEREDDYKSLVYQLNPTALTSKYNNRFISKIQYVQFIEDKIMLYIITENNTAKSISIDSQKALYLSNDKGNSVKSKGIKKISTSSNYSEKNINSYKITFQNPNWNTSSFELEAYTNYEGEDYSKKVKMIIKVK